MRTRRKRQNNSNQWNVLYLLIRDFTMNGLVDPRIWTLLNIDCQVKYRPGRWLIQNFANLHLLSSCTNGENFSSMRLAEVELWKLPSAWLTLTKKNAYVSDTTANCFSKGVSFNLVHRNFVENLSVYIVSL